MKLADFDYHYPEELIAQHPPAKRGQSRMLVLDCASGKLQHSHITQLSTFLRAGDLLVLNNTRVVPARLFGTRKGQPIELLVIEPSGQPNIWRCLLKRAKNVGIGEQFFFGMHATAKACGREDIFLLVEFKGDALKLAMEHHGAPPLPPYITREGLEAYTQEDRERYQTVFARKSGSAAAPTAGLHFDEAMLEDLKTKGVKLAYVTLHVGIDTFAPVRVDDLDAHKMHGERVEISPEMASKINQAKRDGRRVIAIGTTSCRALESAANEDGTIRSGAWTTELFIVPGYQFKVIDGLLTNFHQPKSTLIVLVSSLITREKLLECYQAAIAEKYRLFSFGDCMLVV